ncbi:hypothetical protein CBR_g28511 [Chara braunii]|uniref:ArsA/GET3 Anion-transporting ATPase-like domain-containing protein n=1 Tax=Chara braunii TaxID=69332 RepID=A0A388JW74_CHABU|nr:hypothetical protein CBR_g28511 [Chara braunii]|eukprot:GBG62035.1 hypothetical protein CBR_g28511 [Chara braunii]
MDYSTIVFDTAPTGHTLRLLQFPSTLEKGLGKMVALKAKFGGIIGQFSRMFGMTEEFAEDQVMGKLESMRAVIEQVNDQFKNPDLTTFVCVCIPEFLSLYETERLVQELAKFEIDTHNIIINQVIYKEEVMDSKLLQARVKMQQKYLDQFHDLYEDFHITKLPLLEEEVRGVDALKQFAKLLLEAYHPRQAGGLSSDAMEAVCRENEILRKRVAALEEEVKALQKGKAKLYGD